MNIIIKKLLWDSSPYWAPGKNEISHNSDTLYLCKTLEGKFVLELKVDDKFTHVPIEHIAKYVL